MSSVVAVLRLRMSVCIIPRFRVPVIVASTNRSQILGIQQETMVSQEQRQRQTMKNEEGTVFSLLQKEYLARTRRSLKKKKYVTTTSQPMADALFKDNHTP